MKKKVLFVINTMGHAGAEVALLELLRHFSPKAYEVSLYVLMGQGELIHSVPEYVQVLNTRYSDKSVLSAEGRSDMKKSVLRALFCNGHLIRKVKYLCQNLVDMKKRGKVQLDKLLWRVLSDGAQYPKETYDLAVAYLEGGATYYVADHVQAVKKAAFVHIDYENAGYTRLQDKNCYQAFDRIFAVSDEVRGHFLAVYPEYENKTSVFHNMINQENISRRAKEQPGFTDGFSGKRLLTVGRLNYQKAYDIAICAMKLIKEHGHHVRWYVLGEGECRAAMEKQIAELGLEKDFILMGAVENPYPYYAQCDIYVHATRYEGKSIAIQEAQTLGCAIIASDCNGNREQIMPKKDGLLCELTPEGICACVEELLLDEEKRRCLGRAAGEKKFAYDEDMKMLQSMLQ